MHKRDLRGAVCLLPLEGVSWFLAVVALEDHQSLALDCAAAVVSACLVSVKVLVSATNSSCLIAVPCPCRRWRPWIATSLFLSFVIFVQLYFHRLLFLLFHSYTSLFVILLLYNNAFFSLRSPLLSHSLIYFLFLPFSFLLFILHSLSPRLISGSEVNIGSNTSMVQ